MRRLTSLVTLMLVLLISAASAQVDPYRDRDRDRDRNRGFFDNRDRDQDRDRNRGNFDNRDRDRDWDRDRNRGGNFELVLLGERTVEFRTDRDVINVGQSEDWFRTRSFRALRFYAERNDVEMNLVRVVYFNGYSEEVPIDKAIPRGRELRVDLAGDRSYIRQIEMIYRSRPEGGRALVRVYGEPARFVDNRPPGRDDWVRLGCRDVDLFGPDRDTIAIGQREGRFKAIRLHVRNADVEVLDLKVIYAGGDPDDIPVRRFLRAGEYTDALDLRGFERAIDRVEMVYRSRFSPADIVTGQRIQRSRVCVQGLQQPR